VFLSTYQIPLGQIESVRLNEKTYHVPSSTEYHHTMDPVSYSNLYLCRRGLQSSKRGSQLAQVRLVKRSPTNQLPTLLPRRPLVAMIP